HHPHRHGRAELRHHVGLPGQPGPDHAAVHEQGQRPRADLPAAEEEAAVGRRRPARGVRQRGPPHRLVGQPVPARRPGPQRHGLRHHLARRRRAGGRHGRQRRHQVVRGPERLMRREGTNADRRSRRSRRGMTLMEILVALAIMIAVAVVLVPSATSIFELRQRKAAKELVLLYQQLNDEAVLRNATFRVVYDLRNNTYEVEVTEGGALIYSSADQRERLEEERERMLSFMSEEEK